ncbi:MAG: exodeoxyribonuclease VII small subunit [Oscillospiraceae bacterium]|nr:exodeoxyribonuclease VII small subunit [Oscillospiraceae bacterium]
MSEKKSFEESITRLEEVVKLLERGDAPLDSALALFEEGTALIKTCSKMLDDAEQKVTILSKGDTPSETPFDREGIKE